MTRQALGRGLRALIPEGEAMLEARDGTVAQVPVEEIEPNPFQPRRQFSEEQLQELADSIRAHGVLEPLVVRPWGREGEPRYQLVIGERRWRAARLAGVATVPVMVRRVDDRQMLQMALVENLQREDLNPLEQARAYRRLMEEFGLTQEEVARVVGRKRPTVANTLRLLELEEPVQAHLLGGRLTEGHAKALLGLPAGPGRTRVAERVVQQSLSVRETEALVRRLVEGVRAGSGTAGGRGDEGAAGGPAGVRPWGEMEAALERTLGTRVVIREGRRRGRIEIEFYSREELLRLLELLARLDAGVGEAGA